MTIPGGMKIAAGLFGLLALAACDTPLPEAASSPPEARPEPAPEPKPIEPEIVEPSEASKALATYYRRLQNDLLTQGLLRGDGGGDDTPFTDTQLARNFIRIALFDEYVTDGDILRPQATLSRLRRWDRPVRMSVEFGPTVSPDQQTRDRTSVATYASRLSKITGLQITQTDRNPNFHVLVLNEDDRQEYTDRLREIVPGIANSSLRAITNLPREQLCVVVAFSEGNGASYSKAVAVIRAEHPDLLRTTCFHEELAQGLGLANDSPQARPSIFNDDEEFGLLTRHDELLLKMLYDDRFETGMSVAEAAPIARVIATELVNPGPI
ncbi:MAG: DUF2927 domain-containing protein [Pseudomonadota bacterium]